MSVNGKKSRGKKTTSKIVARKTRPSTETVATVQYKPGSLLGRRGGMVPTVRLSKRASITSI